MLFASPVRAVWPAIRSFLFFFCTVSCEQCCQRSAQLSICMCFCAVRCEQCDKRFAQLGTYQSHLVVHSKQRNHVCSLCDATFLRRSHLSVHLKKHTRCTQHHCQQCGLVFNSNGRALTCCAYLRCLPAALIFICASYLYRYFAVCSP